MTQIMALIFGRGENAFPRGRGHVIRLLAAGFEAVEQFDPVR